MVLAGVLDIDACRKAARFVRFCDCLRHPDRHLRRRARLPARHRAGIRRPDQARRQAPVRLCRGDGAEGDRHHPQGLRRRLRRDGLQAPPRRRQLRLADGRRSRSWAPRARWRSSSARTSATPRRSRRSTRPNTRPRFLIPFVGGRARLHRRRDHAARDPPPRRPRAAAAAAQAAVEPLEEARQHPALRRENAILAQARLRRGNVLRTWHEVLIVSVEDIRPAAVRFAA